MQVWRLKTKPGGASRTQRAELIRAMLDEGFVCTGWHVDRPPASAEDYVRQLSAAYPEKFPRSAKRFATETNQGDLVWIVDLDGLFHLGCITGAWHYSVDARPFGIHAVNRFACEWIETCRKSSEVASGVRNALTQGQTYARINDEAAVQFTRRLSGMEDAVQPGDFLKLIDHEALEDLVGIYLQHSLDGYIIPSSAKRSNAAYEFVIRSWDGQREAVAQVKSGNSSISECLESIACERYLFALNGSYPADRNGARIIDASELIRFATENAQLMPSAIRVWMGE